MTSFPLHYLSNITDYDNSSKFDVLSEFYNIHAKPSFPALCLSTELVYSGKASATFLSNLFDPKTDELYCTKTDHLTTINRSTREVAPIPDWWKKKYGPYAPKGEHLRLPAVVPPDCEDSDHVCEMMGSWNDVNTAFYLGYEVSFKLGMHGIMDAVADNKLTIFHHHIQKYPIKSVNVRYIRAARAGDNIKIFIRQSKDNPFVIDVALCKKEQTICQMTIDFEIQF